MSEHSLGPLFPVAVSGVLHSRRIHQCLSLLGSDGTLSFLLQTKDLAGAIITTLRCESLQKVFMILRNRFRGG